MDRSLALDVVSDEDYFPLFQRYCRPLCTADEHYVQTLVSVRNYEQEREQELNLDGLVPGRGAPGKIWPGPDQRGAASEDEKREQLQLQRHEHECLLPVRQEILTEYRKQSGEISSKADGKSYYEVEAVEIHFATKNEDVEVFSLLSSHGVTKRS
ncbi:hypothetical protein ZIOFF_044313 [Zingiber officinale]|uniref:Uncharacterized protein n=1 Tax=Zingiber officinale TaxID=94328 RepID=A0A8J5FYA1_ZINOF|nr:hypothetical protein ZIOFF_044313 [Zingiber officinale]